ncbi:MAG: phytase [Chloroflexota bacterium]
MKKIQEIVLATKPNKLLGIGLAAFLILVVASVTFAQLSSTSLTGGDTLAVTCNGERLQVIPVANKQVEVICVPGDNPEPPAPEPTSEPEPPEPEPTPEPEPPSNPNPVPGNIDIDPVAQTTAVDGDADDPAIWVHPTDASKSVIIANSKSAGIYVWNINGELLQHLPQGTRVNNVDLRGNIVMANLREVGKLAVFVVNPDYDPGSGNVLTQIAGRDSSNNDIQDDSYGFGIYQRLTDGQLFVFDKPKGGGVLRQYQVDINGNEVVVTAVRTLDYDGGVTEGMVGDDELGFFYVAEEGEAIHKFLADPSSSGSPIASFATGDGISGDREGLTLYKQAGNQGYLLLSSQGNDTIKVYDRQTNGLITTISHSDASSTDGLDITSASLPGFPSGMLVTHDGDNRYNIYNWADTGLSN